MKDVGEGEEDVDACASTRASRDARADEEVSANDEELGRVAAKLSEVRVANNVAAGVAVDAAGPRFC